MNPSPVFTSGLPGINSLQATHSGCCSLFVLFSDKRITGKSRAQNLNARTVLRQPVLGDFAKITSERNFLCYSQGGSSKNKQGLSQSYDVFTSKNTFLVAMAHRHALHNEIMLMVQSDILWTTVLMKKRRTNKLPMSLYIDLCNCLILIC